MANNVPITAGSGTSIGTDDVAGVQIQLVKLVDGTEDSATRIAGDANGLDVDVVRIADTSTSGVVGSVAVVCTLSGLNGANTVGVSVIGAFSATLQFEVSVDGTNWLSANAIALITGALVTNTTGQGGWQIDVAGMNAARVRCSVYTSGSPTVTMRSSVTGTGAVSLDAPLPTGTNSIGNIGTVATVSSVSAVIAGTGATNLGKAEDAAHTTGDTGVMALGVRNDTGAVVAGTDGDYIPLTTDNLGRMWTAPITDVVASGTVGSVAVVCTTASFNGMGTAAISVVGAMSATLFFEATIDGTNWFTFQAANWAGTPGLPVNFANAAGNWQGDVSAFSAVRVRCSSYTSGSPVVTIRVSVARSINQTQSLPAGSNTIGGISGITSAIVPGTAAGNLGKAEDAAHSSGDTGVMMLGVRNDTLSALAGTTLDYIPMITDSLGRQWVGGASKPTKVAVEKVRPADTNAYIASDCITNATSGATNWVFAVGLTATGSGLIVDASLATDASAMVARIEVDLYDTNITVIQDNAEATRLYANQGVYIGTISFPALVKPTANSTLAQAVVSGLSIPFACAGSSSIYGIMRTLDAFTPVSGAKYTVTLKVVQY